MSHLVKLDITKAQEPETYRYEYGKYIFEEPPGTDIVNWITINAIKEDAQGEKMYYLTVMPQEMVKGQKEDEFCQQILKAMDKREVKNFTKDEDCVLTCITKVEGQPYQMIVLPKSLVPYAMDVAHDLLGHNGSM